MINSGISNVVVCVRACLLNEDANYFNSNVILIVPKFFKWKIYKFIPNVFKVPFTVRDATIF